MNVVFRQPLPLLETDILRTFVSIAETNSFSAAADMVLRTPSAVSMQIKKLEEQLGATLFRRDARSVSLTENGEMLLAYARQILSLSNEAVSRFRFPEMSGVVRLGATDDSGERILPNILKRFAEACPGILVDVTIDSSSNLRKRLQEGRLDLALVNSYPGTGGDGEEVVLREKLVWAGAKCGNAFRKDPLPISIWEEGCCWRADALARLDKSKRSYRIAYLSAHTMAQRAAVVADLAIAPIPRSYLGDQMEALGDADGLPELGYFEVRLLQAAEMNSAGEAVAESIRHAFAGLTHAAAAA